MHLPFVERLDAWINPITGQGTASDPATASFAAPQPPMGLPELKALMRHDGIGRRICNRPVEDALRDPPRLKTEPGKQGEDLAEALDDFAIKLKVWPQVVKAASSARGLGGGVLFVGTNDRRWDTPMLPGSAITHVTAFTREEIRVTRTQDNPLLPGYCDHLEYKLLGNVQSPTGGLYLKDASSIVHASRVIRFRGEQTDHKDMQGNDWWDDSVFESLRSALMDNATCWSSSAALVGKANMLALKLQGLRKVLLGAKGAEADMERRLSIIRMGIGVLKMIAVDADSEEITNIATSFGGLADILDRNIIRVSAESGIPVTILWGQSPAGMNATGDADWRNWEDFESSYRASKLDEPITQLFSMMLAAKNGPSLGEVPDRIDLKWKPLRMPTDAEEAETRLKDSQALTAYVESGVLPPEAVAIAVSAQNGYTRDVTVDTAMLEKALSEWDPQEQALQEAEAAAAAQLAAKKTPMAPQAQGDGGASG